MSERLSETMYQETQLTGGPLVLSRNMPEAQTVALGFFVDAGSRDELPQQAGIAHALEHMLFKGTRELDVHQLAVRLDALGGNANAFTSRERTCFHMHVLYEDWQEALSLLAGMLLSPALPEEEWQREREVIFSEMAMVEDTPDEWVHDQHMSALFPDSTLGCPTLGTVEALRGMAARDLRQYLETRYRPPRLLVSAAGRIDHVELVDALAALAWPQAGEVPERKPAVMAHGHHWLPREMEQAQLILSWAGIPTASAERPVAWLANQILGGGMSSYLFREVREMRGLAYSVSSHLSTYSDTGLWSIACGTDPELLGECMQVIEHTLSQFVAHVPEEVLERGQRQLEVQLRMGMDSVEGNMLYLGGRLDENHLMSQQQWVEAVRGVTPEQLQAWVQKHLRAPHLRTIAGSERALTSLQKLV